MLPTLDDALTRIAELENSVARLERLVIGSSELGIKSHAPANPLPSDALAPSGQPFSNGEAPLPQLDSELVDAFLAGSPVTPRLPGKVDIKSAIEESFPKIAQKLTMIWGHPECEAFLNNLMIDSRGNRQGFNLDVMSELMLLTAITGNRDPDMWTDFAKIGDRR